MIKFLFFTLALVGIVIVVVLLAEIIKAIIEDRDKLP